MTGGIAIRPETPLITIAIPTYNRASWLKDCVHSALSQTYQNFEVIVSDNASTDNTPQLLTEFDDPRLRVVRQNSNIGLMPNWNACLAEAKGEYIVFLADDDRLAPWMLEHCVQLLQRERLVMIVSLNDLWLTDEHRTLPALASSTLGTGIHDGADLLIEYLKGKVSVQLCTLLMRTELLRRAGGFPLDRPYAGDTAAWGCLLMSGRVGLVNESCGTFAWHSTSATSRASIDALLGSGRWLVGVIDEAADHCITGAKRRSNVKRHVRGYVARDAVRLLASYRKGGASVRQAASAIWQWRREFRQIRMADIVRLARPLATIVLPGTVTAWLGWLRSRLRGHAQAVSQGSRSGNG